METTLRIWAEIIIKAATEHPEQYPYIHRLFVAPNLENGIKLEAHDEKDR